MSRLFTRLGAYITILLSTVLVGNSYSQNLPEKPRDGFFYDNNNGLVFYFSSIDSTDYYSYGCSLEHMRSKARETAESRKDFYLDVNLKNKDLHRFDTDKNMIIDDNEDYIIRKRYARKEGL